MMSPQLWAISIGSASTELLRVTQRHFDQLKCLSCAMGELSQAVASLMTCEGVSNRIIQMAKGSETTN
jgi:hypothetical protein